VKVLVVFFVWERKKITREKSTSQKRCPVLVVNPKRKQREVGE